MNTSFMRLEHRSFVSFIRALYFGVVSVECPLSVHMIGSLRTTLSKWFRYDVHPIDRRLSGMIGSRYYGMFGVDITTVCSGRYYGGYLVCSGYRCIVVDTYHTNSKGFGQSIDRSNCPSTCWLFGCLRLARLSIRWSPDLGASSCGLNLVH